MSEDKEKLDIKSAYYLVNLENGYQEIRTIDEPSAGMCYTLIIIPISANIEIIPLEIKDSILNYTEDKVIISKLAMESLKKQRGINE